MAVVSSADAGLRAASSQGIGATILQLRSPALSAREVEREARALIAASPVPVLVSSRCDIALAVGAAGVNLPERDIAASDARQMLGDRLVGRSVHSMEGALGAEADGADFVIFGPVWASATHADLSPAGLEALSRVCRAVAIPVLAIGGVTLARIAQCHAAGASGFAAIRLFQ
jgi:thiamine-phosphate pyrophosphorylase